MKLTKQHYDFYMRKNNTINPSWMKKEWESKSCIDALINLQCPDKRDYGFFIQNMLVTIKRHCNNKKALQEILSKYSIGGNKTTARLAKKILKKIN